MAATVTGFSTREVMALTGFTFRQLDRWARIEPERLGPTHPAWGSGSRRVYSDRDVAGLMRARALYEAVRAIGAEGTSSLPTYVVASFVVATEDVDPPWHLKLTDSGSRLEVVP